MAEHFQSLLTSLEALGTLRIGFAIVENHFRWSTLGMIKERPPIGRSPVHDAIRHKQC